MRNSIWAALLFFGVTTMALAESPKPTVVGIPTAQFNFVSASQLKTEWCWAASVQMVLNWYDIPVTQSEVVNRIYHKNIDAAASENQIATALSGTAYDRHGRKLEFHTVRQTGIPTPELLVGQLSEEHPMLITVHADKKMLHAVVLTSAEYIATDQGLHVTALTLRDPNPTFPEKHTAAALRLTGEELRRFVQKISSYYIVSVKN
jgi:hypothetical protein